MNPYTFKLFLTGWFAIGAVIAILAQLWSIYAFRKGVTKKVTLNTTWIINPILIYGIWNWL